MQEKIKVGILKETKIPADKRCAVTPKIASKMVTKFTNIELFVQSSDIRAFKDQEYKDLGLNVVDDVSDCSILIGVKEVRIEKLLNNKKYLFFSHTAKKQAYNRPLLQAFLEKKITMIDHEYLTNTKGNRLVAFGYWAGVVGAYNALRGYGKRMQTYDLPKAVDSKDTQEIYGKLSQIKLPNLKILISGGGRVASGAENTLAVLKIKQVSVSEFLTKEFNEPVYAIITPEDYVKNKDGGAYNEKHFFAHPSNYVSNFERFTKVTDIYIACHFWDEKSPKFITNDNIKAPDFKISVIADVSCDIADPIASTIRPSEIDDPFYGFNKVTLEEDKPFAEDAITVMAVDNLPGEVPRDASEDFSKKLFENIFPALFGLGDDDIIKRATITTGGELGPNFKYLKNFAEIK